jgi:hypothetical protein
LQDHDLREQLPQRMESKDIAEAERKWGICLALSWMQQEIF